jgi:hypothetical protein
MPKKALSDRVKKHKANQANEHRLRQAAMAYLTAKKSGEKLSYRKVGEEFGVDEGLPRKNWPKAPIRPRKPKLPDPDEVEDEDGEEDDEEYED